MWFAVRGSALHAARWLRVKPIVWRAKSHKPSQRCTCEQHIRVSSEAAGSATSIRSPFISYQVEGKKKAYTKNMLIEHLGSTSSSVLAMSRHIAQVWKPSVIDLAATPLEWRRRTAREAVEKCFSKICSGTWVRGRSQVRRLLQRGWMPPHSAVCKAVFPLLG